MGRGEIAFHAAASAGNRVSEANREKVQRPKKGSLIRNGDAKHGDDDVQGLAENT